MSLAKNLNHILNRTCRKYNWQFSRKHLLSDSIHARYDDTENDTKMPGAQNARERNEEKTKATMILFCRVTFM